MRRHDGDLGWTVGVSAQRLKFRVLEAALSAAEMVLPTRYPGHDAETLIRVSKTKPSAGAREGLARLLAALDADSELTMFGRLSVRFDCIRLLKNAQRVDDTLSERPELAARGIRRPIFILGLPRSGTTFLHGLLAADDKTLVPRNWQTMFPAPRPVGFDASRDVFARKVERQLRFFAGIAPGFDEHHPATADSPQECSEITACVFQSLRFDTTYRVPRHLAWMDAHGHDEAFAFHKRFLQMLQAGLGDKTWVLKCPDHTFSLDAILRTYPDARFVVVHRNPVAVFGSVAHLTEILRKPFVKNVDPIEIGRQVTERWIDGAERLVAFDRRADVPEARKIHVQYDDLVAEPLSEVARIYGHFGVDFAPAAEAAMAAMVAARPRGGYAGQRQYGLQKFGIRPEVLAPRFARYMDYFHVLSGVR